MAFGLRCPSLQNSEPNIFLFIIIDSVFLDQHEIDQESYIETELCVFLLTALVKEETVPSKWLQIIRLGNRLLKVVLWYGSSYLPLLAVHCIDG